MKFTEAMIAWNPDTAQIEVGPMGMERRKVVGHLASASMGF